MPVIEILNPQDPIPEVLSMYTALEGVEVKLDLNEDSWATDYFIIFFHTGPNDPVSTSILRTVDAANETLPCKVVGVSMDTTNSIFDWLASNPDLKEFNVPLMSDRDAEISRAFGVIQKGYSDGQMLSGFPANSVFIVDSKDRVRHHTVLDPRAGWNMEEVARMVAAYRHTDGGQRLAMAGWKGEQDSVDNKIPDIAHFYATVYGDEEDARDGADTTITDLEAMSKAPSGRRIGERVGFGGDQQFVGREPTPMTNLSNSSRSKSDKCSDCPDRNCLNCPEKKRGSNSKCSDCSSVKSKGSETKDKQKKSWWPLRPFSFWPTTKQQEGEEKEVEEGKVSSRAVWKRS